MPQQPSKPRARDGEGAKSAPETMHDREEVGQEVASDLTLGGMGTFLSAGAKGVNLIATNTALTATIPVRIVTDLEGVKLKLKVDDAKQLADAHGVVAFLLGEPDERDRYYIPVADFLAKTTLRDGRHVLDFEENVKWLRAYEGHAGVKKAFAKLVKKATPKPTPGA